MEKYSVIFESDTSSEAICISYIASTSVVNSPSFPGLSSRRRSGVATLRFALLFLYQSALSFIAKQWLSSSFSVVLSLSDSPSVSFSDLTATVASYFDTNTGSTERRAERIVESIYHDFFHVANLQGIGFIDFTGIPTMISDLSHRVADITSFTFRSSINTVDVDQRFPSYSSRVNFCWGFCRVFPLLMLPLLLLFLPLFVHHHPLLHLC